MSLITAFIYCYSSGDPRKFVTSLSCYLLQPSFIVTAPVIHISAHSTVTWSTSWECACTPCLKSVLTPTRHYRVSTSKLRYKVCGWISGRLSALLYTMINAQVFYACAFCFCVCLFLRIWNFLIQNEHRGGNKRVAYAQYVDVLVYNTTVRLSKQKKVYVST